MWWTVPCPTAPNTRAEMTILRWTGRPSLALINSIGTGDHREAWQAALGQFFQVVRTFDAVRAPFEQHLSLLRAFGQLEPGWEVPLDQATRLLSEQRRQRRHQAAVWIADTLAAMMAHQVRQRLTPGQAGDSGRAEPLRDRWFRDQRRQEQTLRTRIEHLVPAPPVATPGSGAALAPGSGPVCRGQSAPLGGQPGLSGHRRLRRRARSEAPASMPSPWAPPWARRRWWVG